MKDLNDYIEDVERQIEYTFENTDLLFQAFTRRSYSQENSGENNEVLEFIGDRVLDFYVTKNDTSLYEFNVLLQLKPTISSFFHIILIWKNLAFCLHVTTRSLKIYCVHFNFLN